MSSESEKPLPSTVENPRTQIICPHCGKPILCSITTLALRDCGWFGHVTEDQCKTCPLGKLDRLKDCPEPVDD